MNLGKNMRLVLCVAFAALFSFACSLTAGQATQDETITISPNQQELTPCAFMWASEPLPDVSAHVQAALNTAGLSEATVQAEAYGENCVEGSGKVRSFGAMETDFRVRLPVADLSDRQALGDLVEKALAVLDQFPPGTVPGPQPGYIGVEFSAGQDTLNLWFTVSAGKSAREQALHGADLLAALNNN
jgi:hypothetical protein